MLAFSINDSLFASDFGFSLTLGGQFNDSRVAELVGGVVLCVLGKFIFFELLLEL